MVVGAQKSYGSLLPPEEGYLVLEAAVPSGSISYHTGWPRFKGKGHRPPLSMESNVKELADTPSNHSDCMLLRSECVAGLLLAMRCWAVLFSENRPPPPNTLCVLEGSFSQEGFFRKGMRAQPPFQGWHMTP